jgi:hypothetical protein
LSVNYTRMALGILCKILNVFRSCIVPAAADIVSAEAGMLTCKILAASASSKDGQNRILRMMFAGRAAATKANILFNICASANFVLKTFAKQTGITVRPIEYTACLAGDKTSGGGR